MVVKIQAISSAEPFQPEGPQPLVCEPPEGQPYPVEALGGLKGIVEAVQGETLAPVAIAAQSALACASLSVQAHADVETLAGRAPTSLFCMTVAVSGERKSTVDDLFMKPINECEQDAAKYYVAEMADWENEVAVWTAKHQQALDKVKKASGTGVDLAKEELNDLNPRPQPPARPELTVTEPTFEGLWLALSQGRPSIGIFSDEGGQFLGGYAMNSENQQKSLAAFNALWSGKPIKRTRRGDGVSTLYGRRTSIHLLLQPVVMRRFSDDAIADDIGFSARFLTCQPKSTIGERYYCDAKFDPSAKAEYEARMNSILMVPLPIDEHTRALKPRLLPLSPEAKQLLVGFADELEERQAAHGDLSSVTAAASKAPEQTARIAAVMTLWSDLEAPEVGPEVMADGIALARYYLEEAVRLSSAATMTRELANAETLRVWLLERFLHDEVLTRDVQKDGPSRSLRTSSAARAALTVLEKHGWLIPGALVRGSNRKEAWRIVGKV